MDALDDALDDVLDDAPTPAAGGCGWAAGLVPDISWSDRVPRGTRTEPRAARCAT